MAWNEAVITDLGLSVLAKGILEGSVLITSAVGGESCSAADLLSGMSEIAPPVHTLNLAKAEIEQGKAVVNVRVQNKGVRESFVIRQIGLFSKIRDSADSPVLTAVIQDKNGEVVPTEKENPEFLLEFDLVIPIENKENTEISVTPNTFATLGDLEERERVLSGETERVAHELRLEKEQSSSHISNLSNPHSVTKEQVGLANVPNVATNDQTPVYARANTLAELASGEKLSTAFGKLSKGIFDLIAHLADGVKHISAAERTSWNGKTKTSFSRTLNSGTKIGTINIDGTATDIFCEKNTNTTYNDMTAATASAAGRAGLVPPPAAGAQAKYLRGDGTWQTPPDTNTTYGAATATTAGLMSANDKSKLDGIAAGANKFTYTLPAASSTARGGVKIGYAANGRNYPVQLSNEQMYVNVPWTDNNTTYSNMTAATASAAGRAGLVPAPAAGAQAKYLRGDGTWQTPPDTNTTYGAATATTAGLMSANDKSKLDGIAARANKYVLPAAASGTMGGVKIGYAQNGSNYAVQLSEGRMYVNVPIYYPVVTISVLTSGNVSAMSAAASAYSADIAATPTAKKVSAVIPYPSNYTFAVIEVWYKTKNSAASVITNIAGQYDCISISKSSSAQISSLELIVDTIACSMEASGKITLSCTTANVIKSKVTWYK